MVANAALADRHYNASWVDRLADWVERLPMPSGAFYIGLALLWFVVATASKWLAGSLPVGQLRWIYGFYALYGVYFLAAVHYLDRRARTAFEQFRPVLAGGEAEQSALLYQLTTMPARTVWLISAAVLAGVLLLLQPLVVPLWESVGIRAESPLATIVDLALIAFNAVSGSIFIYHTLRQLRWISRIHDRAARVNLFSMGPLYSLSGLTARTAGILLLAGYLVDLNTRLALAENPAAAADRLPVSAAFPLASIVFYSLLGLAAFVLPLLGVHQLLNREKGRLLAEVDARLQQQIAELHRRVDGRRLEDADALHKQLSSLALERELVIRLPTWPWEPGIFNVVLTAVLLPVVVWLLQQLLGRWVGF